MTSHDPSGWDKNALQQQRVRCLSGGGGLRASYRSMRMFHHSSMPAIVFVLTSDAQRAGKLAVGAAGGQTEESGGRGERVIGRVVPQEARDGGCSSLDVTGARVEHQCHTDFCVPKYARERFNLTTSVESGFLVDWSSGASSEEGLALEAAGGREEEETGCAGGGCGGDGIGRVVPQEAREGGCSSLDVTGARVEHQCRTDFCVPKHARDSLT